MTGHLSQFPTASTRPSTKAAPPATDAGRVAPEAIAEDLARLEEERAERRRRKEIDRVDENRVLDPWERYRALSDHCDGAHDLTEVYDKKTRFALLILAGLNALNLLIVAKSDVFITTKHPGAIVVAYVALYVLISLYLFAFVISALRPRRWSIEPPANTDRPDTGPGLRMTRNILDQNLGEYCENWRQVQVGSMNRELAVIAYMTAQMNAAKHRALHRVYVGLYVLVAMTAVLVIALGYTTASGRAANPGKVKQDQIGVIW